MDVSKIRVPALLALAGLGAVGAWAWQFGRDLATRSEVSATVTASQAVIAEQIKTATAGLEVTLRELRSDWKAHDDRLRDHGESLAAVKAELRTMGLPERRAP